MKSGYRAPAASSDGPILALGAQYPLRCLVVMASGLHEAKQPRGSHAAIRAGECFAHDTLPKPILQGTPEDGRRRGRRRKLWMDSVKGWTSLSMPELLTVAFRRKKEDLC